MFVKRIGLAALALIVASACGSTAVQPTPTPPATATSTASPSMSATPSPAIDNSLVYFARDRLPPVGVHVAGADAGVTPEQRIRARLDALYAAAAPVGLFNVARAVKAHVASVAVNGDLVTIDFSVPGDDWGTAGSTGTRAFVQQIIYTASEESAIRRVLMTQNGGKQAIVGGEGLVIDHPGTREDVLGYQLKASLEGIRSFEGAAPVPPTATLASSYSVDEVALGLARLEVTLVRPGTDTRWLPAFDVSVTDGAGDLGAKHEIALTVFDGTDKSSDTIVDRTPLRRLSVAALGAQQGTVYRLALDDLRPWRVGVMFDPVRIVLDIGGDPDMVNSNVAVYQPVFGAKVAPNFTLSGMTRAFEATFQYRFTDVFGNALAGSYGTASFGTSAVWGAFEMNLPNVPAGASNIQVFLRSPRDGEITDLVTVPIAIR
jgi:hypothetical protein